MNNAEQIRDFSYTLKNVSLMVVSGDDIYVVTEKDGQFVFEKYLYGGDSTKPGILATHFLSATETFATRSEACVHLSKKLLAEEAGYAQADGFNLDSDGIPV